MPEWIASSHMWRDIFALGAPLAEKALRAVLVYACIVVLLRVFGKRELAQLNPFDLVVLLSLSNTVQNAIIGNDNSLTGGIFGALVLLGVNYLVVRYLFGHRRLDQLLEGEPTLLIERGKVLNKQLAKELLTHSELMAALHRQGFSNLAEIEECVLEPGGGFAIRRKEPSEEARYRAEVLRRLQAMEDRLGALTARK